MGLYLIWDIERGPYLSPSFLPSVRKKFSGPPNESSEPRATGFVGRVSRKQAEGPADDAAGSACLAPFACEPPARARGRDASLHCLAQVSITRTLHIPRGRSANVAQETAALLPVRAHQPSNGFTWL